MRQRKTVGLLCRFGWYTWQMRHCSNSIASIEVRRQFTQDDVDQFASLSGDTNVIHSRQCPPEQRCIHGALLNGLVSAVIGTKLPGPGSIVLAQRFSFPNKCVVDKEITVTVKLVQDRKIKKVQFECKQLGQTVFIGDADLIIRNVNETLSFDAKNE